jgi:Na+/H+ antiporter NhaD/arsenite permease-like protein
MQATPLWAVTPFAVFLVLVALLPLVAESFWEHDHKKLFVACVLSAPVLAYLLAWQGQAGRQAVLHALLDYASFMALLGALFTISGGILVRGAPVATPLVNAGFLGTGALLANLIGTTGASVLLIRPLLRANAGRPRVDHVIVFFIFMVANTGGLLTPLGDPPLFLGLLRGVPFAWTLRLWRPWLFVNGLLLAAFFLFDRLVRAGEDRVAAPAPDGRLRIEGRLNLLWLALLLGFIVGLGVWGARLATPLVRAGVQILVLVGLAVASYATTAPGLRADNRHTWRPLTEVAAVFVGVFVTMIPALEFLGERGAALGVVRPAQFFWASGLLSSVLDNAPTYLAFATLATGVAGSPAADLGSLAAHPVGQKLLAAVSCGSVMMGALTYLGNGPNLMVKAIAESAGVRMPAFLKYFAWSALILLPLYALVSLLFLG